MTAAHDVSPSPSPAGNWAASGAEGPGSDNRPAPLALIPSKCFLCDDDDAEPLAVGEDFDCARPDTFLAVRCRRCGLVYLNPAPAPRKLECTPLLGRHGVREIARFCQRLGHSARVLHVRGVEDLDHPRDAYDAVLLTDVLERVDDPLGTLKATRQLLRPKGIALILTPNTEATVCRVFQGRHWSGYNFPRHRNLFCAAALDQATTMAGLEIVSVRTVSAAEAWVRSVRNTLADWGAPQWALAALKRNSRAALAVASAIEWSQVLQGKGGLLLATVRRPAE